MSRYEYDVKEHFCCKVITHELQDLINEDDNIVPKLLYIDTCDNLMFLNFASKLSADEERFLVENLFRQYEERIEACKIPLPSTELHQRFFSLDLSADVEELAYSFISFGKKHLSVSFSFIYACFTVVGDKTLPAINVRITDGGSETYGVFTLTNEKKDINGQVLKSDFFRSTPASLANVCVYITAPVSVQVKGTIMITAA
jgi:hypothetical protein